MHDKHLERVKVLFLVVVAFIIYATAAYMFLEGLTLTDALLRVMLLSSTLGFSEATTQSNAGKWLTILLIIGGVSMIMYAASTFVRSIVEGEVTGSWKQRLLEKKLKNFKDHIIVCGFGRVGRQIAEEINAEKLPMVIIDKEDKSAECAKLGYTFVHGNVAASDDTLSRTQLSTAKALIIAFGNDSEVLATAVTAKALKPDIYIVARATNKHAEERLLRVGVDRVAMPAFIGGYHMANMALRPNVIDFIDLIIDSKREELGIEELNVDEKSLLAGHKVHEYFTGKRNSAVVLAIRHADGTGFIRPSGETEFKTGDRMILMGTANQLDDLMKKVVNKA